MKLINGQRGATSLINLVWRKDLSDTIQRSLSRLWLSVFPAGRILNTLLLILNQLNRVMNLVMSSNDFSVGRCLPVSQLATLLGSIPRRAANLLRDRPSRSRWAFSRSASESGEIPPKASYPKKLRIRGLNRRAGATRLVSQY